MLFKCLIYNKNHKNYFNKDARKRSLSLRIHGQLGKINKTLLDKKEFYSNLAKEDITDKNYKYAKKSMGRI